MAILFDFYHSPSLGEESKQKYHARVVGGQSVDLSDIVQHISQRSTLSKGDIHAVISELSDEIASALLHGDYVTIPGIGNFSLSLQAPKDANPKKTHAQNINIKRIEFRADFQLKQRLKSEAVFERCQEKMHSAHINSYEIDSFLIDYFKEHAFITRKGFENLCHFTRSTASRHLKRLLNEGKLINTNTQRNPIFEPAKGFYIWR